MASKPIPAIRVHIITVAVVMREDATAAAHVFHSTNEAFLEMAGWIDAEARARKQTFFGEKKLAAALRAFRAKPVVKNAENLVAAYGDVDGRECNFFIEGHSFEVSS